MLLHQRHVLVRRRVIHDLRRVRVQHLFHLSRVENIADDRHDLELLVPTPKLQLGEVEAALGPVEQDERLRLESGELARQLRSDRAGRPRDENTPAVDLPVDLIEVQTDLLTTEEVLRSDLLELTDLRLACEELVERGDCRERYVAGRAAI